MINKYNYFKYYIDYTYTDFIELAYINIKSSHWQEINARGIRF